MRLANLSAIANSGAARRDLHRMGNELPREITTGIEALAGITLNDVRVHRNSVRPALLHAHAYASGADIYLAPGQERHLPHEAWHVVQQKQGRVRGTADIGAITVNDDPALEEEAVRKGSEVRDWSGQAVVPPAAPIATPPFDRSATPVQMLKDDKGAPVPLTSLTYETLVELARYLGGSSVGTTISIDGALFTLEPHDAALIEAEIDARDADDEDYVPTARDEMIDYLTTTGRFESGLDWIRPDDREIKPWPEKMLQGKMGEYAAREAMQQRGASTLDLNAVANNFAGIDNMSDDPTMMIEQTKLHLSDSTATVYTYLAHLNRAGAYAIKAIRGMGRNLRKLRQAMAEQQFTPPAALTQLLQAIGELDSFSDDDIDGSEAHDQLVASMVFSIPSDIYALLPNHVQGHFIDLGLTTNDFLAVLAEMEDDYIPAKPSGSKPKDEDHDWSPK